MVDAKKPIGSYIYEKGLAFFLLCLAQLTFSGYHIVGNYTLSNENAFIFAMYREVFSSTLMFFLFAFTQRTELTMGESWTMMTQVLHTDLKMFLLLGFLSFINVMGSTVGLSLLSPIIFAIMQPLIPCVATTISILANYEPFTWLKLLGVVIAVSGAICVEVWKPKNGNDSDNIQQNYAGIIVCVCQITGCGAYMTFQKSILHLYPSTLITFLYYAIGSCFTVLTVIGYSIIVGGIDEETLALHGRMLSWLAIGYVVFFSTLFAWNAYTYASSYISPSLSTIFMSLQPVFTAILTFFILNVVITYQQLVGSFLVIVGMILTVLAQRGSNEVNESGDGEEGGTGEGEGFSSAYPYRHLESDADDHYSGSDTNTTASTATSNPVSMNLRFSHL